MVASLVSPALQQRNAFLNLFWNLIRGRAGLRVPGTQFRGNLLFEMRNLFAQFILRALQFGKGIGRDVVRKLPDGFLQAGLTLHQEFEELNQIGFLAFLLTVDLPPAVGVVFDPVAHQFQIATRLSMFRLDFKTVTIRSHSLFQFFKNLLPFFRWHLIRLFARQRSRVLGRHGTQIEMRGRRNRPVLTQARFQISIASFFLVSLAMPCARFVKGSHGCLFRFFLVKHFTRCGKFFTGLFKLLLMIKVQSFADSRLRFPRCRLGRYHQ